ncbi:MAG: S1C family serine protease [Acetobacteraceae bacterium]
MSRRPLAALLGLLLALAPHAAARAQPVTGRYDIAVQNVGDAPITGAWFRRAGTQPWGSSRLAGPLARNQRQVIHLAPRNGCQRDVYVSFAGGAHADKLNLNICAFGSTAFAAPTSRSGGSQSVTVKNVGALPIAGFYLAPTPGPGGPLGPDRLATPLAPHQSTRIALAPGACMFDMEARYQGGAREFRQGINLCVLDTQSFAAPAAAVPPPAPASAQASAEAPTDISIVNRGHDPIVRAVFRRGGMRGAGTNRLRGVLMPGQRQLIRLPPADGCIYDIGVAYQHGGSSDQLGLNVCGYSDAVFAAAEPGRAARAAPASLLVRNSDRGPVVRRFYLSPSSAQGNSFGPDRLAAPLGPGQSTRIALPLPGEGPHCDYDMRAIFASGAKEDRYRVNICAIGGAVFNGPTGNATPAPGQHAAPSGTPALTAPALTVANDYRVPIAHLFVSPSSSRRWGPDRLAQLPMIAPQTRVAIGLQGDGCVFDLRAVFDNEVTQQLGRLDLCRTHLVTLTGPKPGALLGRGSGFYISRDGDILTNNHVVYGCRTVAILRDDGRPLTVRVLGQDVRDDLAVLREDGVATAPLRFRDPSIRVAGGETATALGYPLSFDLGAQLKISSGFVSATEVAGAPAQFQMQTPINPGNSGGPVLDSTGAVIGVSVAQLRPSRAENVNFAVRGDVAQRFARSLGVKILLAPLSGAAKMSPRQIYATEGPSVVPLECFN